MTSKATQPRSRLLGGCCTPAPARWGAGHLDARSLARSLGGFVGLKRGTQMAQVTSRFQPSSLLGVTSRFQLPGEKKTDTKR